MILCWAAAVQGLSSIWAEFTVSPHIASKKTERSRQRQNVINEPKRTRNARARARTHATQRTQRNACTQRTYACSNARNARNATHARTQAPLELGRVVGVLVIGHALDNETERLLERGLLLMNDAADVSL